jgi:hypothetical protein
MIEGNLAGRDRACQATGPYGPSWPPKKEASPLFWGPPLGPPPLLGGAPKRGGGSLFSSSATYVFETSAPLLGHMWSTHFYCFQHMPALPRLLLQTSNTHNF